MTAGKNCKIIKADYALQKKIGAGPLDQEAICRSQEVIDKNEEDFEPLGLALLDRLDQAIKSAASASIDTDKKKAALINPVMELKANAAIFHYELIGELASVILSFLESVKEIDEDVTDILAAHHKTIHLIVTQNLRGSGGEHGGIMTSELKSACARYFAKKRQKGK